jgi:hypothetical protein
MKTASQSAEKYASRAAAAAGDYVAGAASTTKDQAAAAIAAAAIYGQATQQAITDGRYAKGLQKSGKSKWLNGITTKGGGRFAEGVGAAGPSYATESARFDTARGAAASMPRGIKGSPANLQRVAAVVAAQIRVKQGK